MTRRMSTMWVAGVAAVALAACGTVAEQPSQAEANPPEPDQEASTENQEGPEPDDPGGQDHDRGTDRDDPGDGARGADATPDGDDGETPWHLLPEDDRPAAVEQPECERASSTPVAC
ncbi:MAG: hypothetical protein R6U94_08510 [Nitriliruptoraceae bacterium]